MAKVTPDNFAAAIEAVLKDYADDVDKNMKAAVKDVTALGAKVLKGNPGGFGGSGKYSKGWTSTVETGRLSAQGTVYNAKLPGLPHLLENGHAKRGGGRVPGKVHIAPVEQQIEETFTKKLEDTL